LLVVIGIIAVLIGILLPSLAKARAQAQQTQCMSNLRQWSMAWYMYCDANRGQLPFDGPDGSGKSANKKVIGPGSYNTPGGPGTLIGVNDQCLWYNAITLYLNSNNKSYYDMIQDQSNGGDALPRDGSNSVFVCPSGEPAGTADTAATGGSDKETIVKGYDMLNGVDPVNTTAGPNYPTYFSYVMNDQLFGTAGDNMQYKGWKLSQLQNASQGITSSECVLMMEKIVNNGEYLDPAVKAFVAQSGTPASANHSTQYGYLGWIGTPRADWKRFTTRHRDGGNLLYADGHVTWHAWTDLQIAPGDPSLLINYVNGGTGVGNGNKPGVAVWNPLSPVN
jgi:prepilin-type processing-associated H-X9-DG protein